MTDIALKYYQLDSSSKKEVVDFLDFLLARNVKSTKHRMTDYKKKILKVSVWSDSDINLMIQNQQNTNQDN
jgi:hypothetical protein